MRKLVVFLLLLGSGLFLLYWLDRRDSAPQQPTPIEPTPPAPDVEETQGFQLGGPSQLTHYDEATKRLLYRVRSEDTRTEGGFDVLTGVTVELYDPQQEDTLQVRLWADRASPRRLASDGFQPNWEERLELEGVRADILVGIPLAPLSFETPRAVIDLTDEESRRIGGEEAFSATSAELRLAGRGFEWRLDTEELLIRHGGRVEFLRPGAEAASLTARDEGSLRLFRATGPEGPITLEADEGAVLEPGAADPGRLEADHMTLRAAQSPGPEAALFIEQLEARGNVDWTSGQTRFQGRHLTAGFRPDGQLDRARLDGEPRAELTLVLSGGVLPTTEATEERLVVLDGQDSLDITWEDDGYKLHLESELPDPNSGAPIRVPTVTTRDFRLKSASTIDGWLARDQRSARFKASGGVLVTSGAATLETAEFEVELSVDANDQATLLGTASGGARLAGELPTEPGSEEPARAFALTSPDGLKIERSASGWRVIESTNVDVTLADPKGFHARAGRITDFIVPRTGEDELTAKGVRFKAEGDVRVDIAGGQFGGDKLDVMGVAPVPHFVLRGSEEARAFLQVEYGEAQAKEIEVTGETLHARENVSGSAQFSTSETPDGVRTTFAGDTLTLDRNESPELLPGERLRTLRILVEGNAQCSVDAQDQTLVVRSDSFSAENRVRIVEGAAGPVELGSLFLSEGHVHADFLNQDSDLTVDCDRFEVERTAGDVERGFRQLIASGSVRFQGRSVESQSLSVGGEGEILVFDSSRRGSLEAAPNSRVILRGVAPKSSTPFRLSADRVDFELSDDEILRLIALRPELRMLGLRARAQHLTADDQQGVRLSGGVRASGATSSNVPFTLDAEDVALVGRRLTSKDEGTNAEDQLDAMSAQGQVDFHLGAEVRARGERLVVKRATGLLRLEGAPASFEFGPTRLETEWVEFDPVLELLVATGRGRLLQAPALDSTAPDESWTLDFLSASTLLELDSVVLVIQEPLFRASKFQSALRASWAILWLNREGFQDSERRSELLRGLQSAFDLLKTLPPDSTPLDKMALLRSTELAGLLREIYFEGPVELLSEGELVARADAVYLDVASQHGWLARATINMGGQFMGQRREKLVIKTDWMRLSSDASLRADRATVTACSFDEPHVRVVTGDLKIEPVRGPGKEHYQLRLKDNRVELYDLLKIPLPTIEVATDKELQPILPSLSLANSARFGTLFGFAFTRPADGLGRAFDSVARPDAGPSDDSDSGSEEPQKLRSEVDAHYKVDASYLGSRGGLLDLGVEIEAKEDYWFDLYAGVVLDNGEDKGFIRVDEDERDIVRRWLRSRAYFDLGKSSWTFSYSDQSDAAVQSEFFEGDFLRYERSETYLQWRRSDDEYFAQGTAKVRVDSFRSDVEELPSFSGYRGRSPLLTMGSLSLLHTGDIRAEYLRRRTGTEPHSPFEDSPTFGDPVSGTLDGLGDREVLRFDTTQAIELPVPIGGGWKLTPFVSGRATAWSEGVEESDSPERLLAEVGARLGTTFWKRGDGGKLHQFAPFVEYRSEIAREDEGGEPVSFDSVEHLLSGDFFRIGSRSRFAADQEGSLLDIDLIGTYASQRSDGAPDGWMPIEVFGRLVVQPLGHEFEIFHDARYDIEKNQTTYSLLSLGTHLGEEWGIQASHQRGRDQEDRALFETASLSGLYRWSEKWEFEGRQSFSLLENEGLDTKVLVRRYGHDIVFELETAVREGEGSSIGISLKPRFRYQPPRVGYVPW